MRVAGYLRLFLWNSSQRQRATLLGVPQLTLDRSPFLKPELDPKPARFLLIDVHLHPPPGLAGAGPSASQLVVRLERVMPLPFSTSQQELIRLLAKGYTDSEIARKMALSPDQLERAFSNLCDRLNVANRIELIVLIWSSEDRFSWPAPEAKAEPQHPWI